MKKTVALAIAGLSLLGAAGQASASYEAGNLMMVAYNETTKEVGVDLGNMTTFLSGLTTSPQIVKSGLDFSAASGPMGMPVSVGFFHATSAKDLYFATTKTTKPVFSTNLTNGTSFKDAAWSIGGYYRMLDTDVNGYVDNASPTYANAYDQKMNVKSVTPGNYAKMNTSYTTGEGKIGADPLTMYLYHITYNPISTKMELAHTNPGVDWSAKLTLDNGTLRASAVPVPAAGLLFGSSLLGLLGLRRKKS